MAEKSNEILALLRDIIKNPKCNSKPVGKLNAGLFVRDFRFPGIFPAGLLLQFGAVSKHE